MILPVPEQTVRSILGILEVYYPGETMSRELCFDDLAPQEVKVTLKGHHYVLIEATAAQASDYRNFILNAGKFDDDGTIQKIGPINDAELRIIGNCLYKCISEGPAKGTVSRGENGLPNCNPVGEMFVRGLPNRISRQLFDALDDMSELREDKPEQLEKTIIRLQKRLAKLKKNLPKDGQPAGPTTSG